MAQVFTLGTSLSIPVKGNPVGGSAVAFADLADDKGYVIVAHGYGFSGTLPTDTYTYQKGCQFTETDTGSLWLNAAAFSAAANWSLIR